MPGWARPCRLMKTLRQQEDGIYGCGGVVVTSHKLVLEENGNGTACS